MFTHGDRHLPCVQRPHTPNTRSLTHTCLIHTHTPAGALTRGVSHTRGGSHTRAASRTHVVSSTCGAPFTHGVPGSTHAGTPVTTPLAHGGSSALGVALGASLAHEGSFKHGGALTLEAPRTPRLSRALTLPACVRRSTHFATLVNTHRDTTHTGSTLATAHTGTFTLGVALTPLTAHTGTLTRGTILTLASTRAPGVFTPPKLCVHPSAALTSSTSRGTTELTWP